MSTPNILPNFGIKTPYKFIIYLSGVIFIASLFASVKEYDVSLVQSKALVILIWGVIVWLLTEILEDWMDYLFAEDDDDEYHKYRFEIKMLFVFKKLFQAAYIIIAIVIIAN